MIIGVDPHKSSHTAAALNPAMNSPVASLRVEASLAGVAPIEVASGERTRHRLSRRGDRQLNSAIHLIAVTQVRMHNSVGRKYFDKKIAEGKTRNEAMRCLKRRLANHLWRLMIADERHLAARPQETPIAA